MTISENATRLINDHTALIEAIKPESTGGHRFRNPPNKSGTTAILCWNRA